MLLPPHGHPEASECSAVEQKSVKFLTCKRMALLGRVCISSGKWISPAIEGRGRGWTCEMPRQYLSLGAMAFLLNFSLLCMFHYICLSISNICRAEAKDIGGWKFLNIEIPSAEPGQG